MTKYMFKDRISIECRLRFKHCFLIVPWADKFHHTTDHEAPDGEKRYSCTLSLISALDGRGWSTPYPGRFSPGNDPVTVVWKTG